MGEATKLTKSVIDKLPKPGPGERVDYYDSELKGFGIRITSRSKRFFVLKRVNGRQTRVMLKPYGVITPDQARKEATKVWSKLQDGIDVNAEKVKERHRGRSLSEFLKEYFETKKLKPRTVETYEYLFNAYAADWLKKPIGEITKDQVAARHKKVSSENGNAAANNLMRTFRAIYNFANELQDDELPQNPVKRLSNTGQWNKIGRRQTVIEPKDLPLVFDAINKAGNPVIKDYLLLLLFTGARRNEVACLKWDSVDMNGKTFTLKITKSGRPLVYPMSDYMYDIFKRRQALQENEYVFPGSGETGHLVEPRKQIDAISLATMMRINGISDPKEFKSKMETEPSSLKPGINFCPHDLRRTFASAISGTVAGGYELKRLLNHSLPQDDVTAGYVIHSLDAFRKLVQEATNHILELCTGRQQN